MKKTKDEVKALVRVLVATEPSKEEIAAIVKLLEKVLSPVQTDRRSKIIK